MLLYDGLAVYSEYNVCVTVICTMTMDLHVSCLTFGLSLNPLCYLSPCLRFRTSLAVPGAPVDPSPVNETETF